MSAASRGSPRRLSGAAAAPHAHTQPCGPRPSLRASALPADPRCCDRSSAGPLRPPCTPVADLPGELVLNLKNTSKS